MGIVKPKFTRRNEIWCRILELEDLSKNVRKTQDRTSLSLWFDFRYSNSYSQRLAFVQSSIAVDTDTLVTASILPRLALKILFSFVHTYA